MKKKTPPAPETPAPGASLADFLSEKAAAFSCDGAAPLRGARATRRLENALARLCAAPDGDALLPASRWFYENARLLEETCAGARESLLGARRLPARGRVPRVTVLCRMALGHGEGCLDAALLEEAAAAWQQARTLTEAELAALPLAATLALVETLSAQAADCAACEQARRAAERGDGPPRGRGRDAYWERRCALLQEGRDGDATARLDALLRGRGDDAEALARREHLRQMRACRLVSDLIRSLRALGKAEWKDAQERLSALHARLLSDPSGVYETMDFAARALYRARAVRLARIFRLPQTAVAEKAVELAAAAGEDGLSRHVGYWLLDAGQPYLWKTLGRVPARLRLERALSCHAATLYVVLTGVGSMLSGALLWALGVRSWLAAPALLIAGEAFRQLSGLLLHRLSPPRMLPRLRPDCLGEGEVLVAVPALLTSRRQALDMVRHLSVLRLANPEKKLSYLLLADFSDGPAAEEPADADILSAALEAVRALNAVWGGGFYYLHRAREWDAREKRFMGRERKRGALEALNRALLEGTFPDPLLAQSAPVASLAGRFPTVITLDADTMLPPGAALKLVGALRHPLNRRVAVLQPRMEQSSAAIRSRVARVFGGQGGFDPYLASFADVYQNLCGEGSFAGKGAYDVKKFYEATRGKIRPDSVLSHDLLEGALAGSATACDIALFDSEPATLAGWMRRLHRWTRGDWQLLPWLLPRVKGETGWLKNPLSLLNRFKIMDNLRRSLVPLAGCLLLIFGLSRGEAIAFLAGLLLPHTRALIQPSRQSLAASFFSLALLPCKAYRLLDAAVRTLFRLLVTHRHLLEWTPMAQAERARGDDALAFWPNLLAAAALVLPALSHPARLFVGAPLALLWCLAPAVRAYLDAPDRAAPPLTASQRGLLGDVAARTFRFFDETVTQETNFLPPDNLQLDPPKGVAPRTSPTNVGLYLLSCVAAMELGLQSPDQASERMAKCADALERLEKWRGHPLNWYDVRTLEALPRRYVSTVDSGNLCACLLLCAQALRARLAETGPNHAALPARLDALAAAMDFAALYDRDAGLFYIGYDLDSRQFGESHYDLLASEARLTSFLAVMRREVPLRHWSRLGRAMTRARGEEALLSWSGTLFEYLLPSLFLRAPRGSLLYESGLGAARLQRRAFGKGPWGVSESGCYVFDPRLSYQYHAFGLPCLSLRTEKPRRVVAPYASALALGIMPREAADNLQAMRELGWLAELGFYEAADYRPECLAPGREYALVKSHMAHHQGMILCAVCNALTGDALTRHFRALPQVEAYSLLLEERRPSRAALRRAGRPRRNPPPAPDPGTAERFPARNRFPFETQAMGDGAGLSFVQDALGNGVIASGDLLLTARLPDPFMPCGPQVYLKTESGAFAIARRGEPRFARGLATYTLETDGLRAELHCFVSPLDGAAVQLVTLRAPAGRAAEAELCSFVDVCLATRDEFESHPAFQRLLVETEALENGVLLARRRPRHAGERFPLLCHVACADEETPFHYETDRLAFLGRGDSLERPAALRAPLPETQGRAGAVLGACLSLRARLRLEPGQTRLCWFVTAPVADAAAALSLRKRFATATSARQALSLCQTQALVTARYLGLSQTSELCAQRMAAFLFSPSPRNGEPLASREELWRFSVSGDLPLVTVRLRAEGHAALAREAVRAHALLRQLGLKFDLVLLSEQPEGYFQPLRDALLSLLASGPARDCIGCPGGVTLVDGGLYPPRAVEALRALSALLLDGDGGSLAAQLAARTVSLPSAPGRGRAVCALRPAAGSVALENGLGGFLADGSYLCFRQPPRPWCQVLCGERLGAVVTDRGAGFAYFENSRLTRLTALLSDPALDGAQEGLWLRDEETGDFSALCRDALVAYGPGYARFRCDALSLRVATEWFVDADLPVRCALVTLENPGETPRRVSLTACARFLLGARRLDALQARGEIKGGACLLRSPALRQDVFYGFAGREAEASLDAAGFLGAGGMDDPPGMRLEHLPEGTAGGPFGAVRAFCTLAPGESADLCLLLGTGPADRALLAFSGGGARFRLAFVKKNWARRLGALRAQTPSTALSVLLSVWLPYQTLASRVTAKAGFQQAGGATGFRDQLQDMLALRHTEPETVRAHLLRAAAHQFEKGDVQHWWHEPALGVRTDIRDDRLFLPYVTAAYVRATGDDAVLRAEAPYLQNVEIPAGCEDFYGPATPSETVEPFLNHCLRALESMELGARGLPLMGAGDWNDGMNRVGRGGKGESVWLAFFLAETLRVFAPLCEKEKRDELLARRKTLLDAADEHAWNGRWYARAWFDDGGALGNPDSPECRIDLVAQVWAVLAGAKHAQEALDAALSRLVDEKNGIVRLLDPPFDGLTEPGYIRAYPPGVRENGGQYTHAASWLVTACRKAGRTQRAWEIFQMLLPTTHADTPENALHYGGEPYVVAADVSGGENAGKAGWTWYTGSAGLLWRAGLETLLGFEKEGNRVRLCPSAPEDWPGYAVEYRFGDTLYRLRAVRGERDDGWATLTDDGKPHELVYSLK